jgi:hypothetical protein
VGWAFVWMMFVLKIPVAAALWLIWWAVREPPAVEEERTDGDGGSRRHRHPRGKPPRPPRRGPHAEPPPRPPERVRVAGAKLPARSHHR